MAQEFNPNNPMTQAAREHWHAILLLTMRKLGMTEVTITPADLAAQEADPLKCITIGEDAAGIHIRLVTWEEGERLARQHGGLPT